MHDSDTVAYLIFSRYYSNTVKIEREMEYSQLVVFVDSLADTIWDKAAEKSWGGIQICDETSKQFLSKFRPTDSHI